MRKKEQNRLLVLNRVEAVRMTGRQAAEVMGISLRHMRRLLVAYRKEGAAALAHGNRSRKPIHAPRSELKSKALALAKSRYDGCNHQHFTELLEEREDIKLSRSSVRRILLGSGMRSPRKRRPPKHRSRRERYPQEGMLLQIDGSPHDWLEGRRPWLSLIGAIDDATGKVPYALFREQEDAQDYFRLLKHIVEKDGIPLALYHDRHSIFELPPDKLPSIEEQLEDKRPLTQFGRLMEELGITSIPALSPQAKGRIERLWRTFQDRLVSEHRLARASTIDEANRVLWEFLPWYSQKCAVPATQPDIAYHPVGVGFVADEVFYFKHQRIVGADNVVRFERHRLQIVPTNGRASYARCRVEVHEKLDGSLAFYYRGKRLTAMSAPPEPAVLRARVKLAEPVVPGIIASPALLPRRLATDHPWRGIYRVFIDKRNVG